MIALCIKDIHIVEGNARVQHVLPKSAFGHIRPKIELSSRVLPQVIKLSKSLGTNTLIVLEVIIGDTQTVIILQLHDGCLNKALVSILLSCTVNRLPVSAA